MLCAIGIHDYEEVTDEVFYINRYIRVHHGSKVEDKARSLFHSDNGHFNNKWHRAYHDKICLKCGKKKCIMDKAKRIAYKYARKALKVIEKERKRRELANRIFVDSGGCNGSTINS